VSLHVELERSGGLAGRTVRRTLDTADLPANTSAELRTRVEAVRERDVLVPGPGPTGADRFTYRLTIREDAEERTVTTSDPVPERLGPLIRLLLAQGRAG
jgi:hypothetical protein